MLSKHARLLVLFAFAVIAAWGQTPGEFRGIVVVPSQDGHPGKWVYIQGRNKLIRKVVITAATVIDDSAIPGEDRGRAPLESLVDGSDVRVTANQNSRGDWEAVRIVILKTAPEESEAVRKI